MHEVSPVVETFERALDDIEPPAFQRHLRGVLSDVTLTPAVLTLRSARALEPSVDVDACVYRGTGVQLTYEGLRLTRSILRGRDWERADRDPYYLDLLAAAVLVSRGYYLLADTGVVREAVDAARRFGRHQTYIQNGNADPAYSLEADFLSLAVTAGADVALQTVPPSIIAYGESLGREHGTDPLSEPDHLVGVEERLSTLVTTPEMTEVDEYDE